MATNFSKLKIILFFKCWRIKCGPVFKELWNFLLKNLSVSFLKNMGLGSGIWDPEKNLFRIPDPGPGSKRHQIPDPDPQHWKKTNFSNKILEFFLPFYIVSCFTRKKFIKFQHIFFKKWIKKMLKEGNQIHNFISSSGSGRDQCKTNLYYIPKLIASRECSARYYLSACNELVRNQDCPCTVLHVCLIRCMVQLGMYYT